MRQSTLCLAIKEDEILLAMKKRGFGVGKWNGVGGKILPGETAEQAALREMKEEIGLHATENDLANAGTIQFYFSENPDFNQEMHVFLVKQWAGEPIESEEMKPEWFRFEDIPYLAMWVDDSYWLPKVLDGKKIEAQFHFKGSGEALDRYEIKEV